MSQRARYCSPQEAHIYGLSWEILHFTSFCHIYHMPSPQQILYLRTASIFSHPTDPLLIRTALRSVLLSTRRALVMQMQHLQTQSCQTGEAASYQAVPESTAPRSICLASADLKEALHCCWSSPVPLDAVSPQDPNSQAPDFWSWYCPRVDVCVPQLRLFSQLFSSLRLHLAISSNTYIVNSPVKTWLC